MVSLSGRSQALEFRRRRGVNQPAARDMVSERKREIISVASSLIRRQGYAAVTMRTLAQEVGVKAASLYNHITSKQEILAHIILGVAQSFTEGMAVAKAMDAQPLDKIKQLISLHIEITIQQTSDMEVMQNNWMYLEGESMAQYKQSRNQYEADLRQIISAGIVDGSIRNVNPELLIYSLLSPLRYLYVWFPRQKTLDAEQLKDELASVLLGGIEN
ncbi:MAG: TetR/AcrR family transcriptional regulator [Bacteroidota bacterium]